jgi:hypothetical protein
MNLKAIWDGAGRARRTMLTALCVNVVSQFFHYSDADVTTYVNYSNPGHSERPHGEVLGMTGIGWAVHWLAIPILAFLFWHYSRPASEERKGFGKWGWWPTLVALWFAMLPSSPSLGLYLGIASFGIAIWAVVLKGREEKAAPKA